MRARDVAALLVVSLVVGQPAGPPANDDLAQAEWVRTLIRFRSNHTVHEVYGSYPGGTCVCVCVGVCV